MIIRYQIFESGDTPNIADAVITVNGLVNADENPKHVAMIHTKNPV